MRDYWPCGGGGEVRSVLTDGDIRSAGLHNASGGGVDDLYVVVEDTDANAVGRITRGRRTGTIFQAGDRALREIVLEENLTSDKTGRGKHEGVEELHGG